MQNPKDVLEALASALRLIPAVADAVEGGDRVRVFDDTFLAGRQLGAEIVNMPVPSMLVAFSATSPGLISRRETWAHQLSVILRVHDPLSVFTAIVNGVPSDGTQRLIYKELIAGIHRMETPTLQRRQIVVSESPFATVDYFELIITIKEKGD